MLKWILGKSKDEEAIQKFNDVVTTIKEQMSQSQREMEDHYTGLFNWKKYIDHMVRQTGNLLKEINGRLERNSDNQSVINSLHDYINDVEKNASEANIDLTHESWDSMKGALITAIDYRKESIRINNEIIDIIKGRYKKEGNGNNTENNNL